jgi:hypothetical protein
MWDNDTLGSAEISSVSVTSRSLCVGGDTTDCNVCCVFRPTWAIVKGVRAVEWEVRKSEFTDIDSYTCQM